MRVIYDPTADTLYIEVLPAAGKEPRPASKADAHASDTFVELTYGDAVAGIELREVSRDLPPRGRVPTPGEVAALVRCRGVTGVALSELHVVVTTGNPEEP